MPLSTSYRQHPIRWFLEPTRAGGQARYCGRNQREGVMVFVPEHQRDYVWKLEKQQNLVRTVFNGYPIPSIMVTQDDRNRYSIQDGQQRLETFFRFYTGEFSYEGVNYADMPDAQKKQFLDYVVPIIDTTGATLDQETEMYDLLNQGMALSDGEKFWNRRTKALVRATEELLMTRGSGLHAAAMDVWGDYLAGADKRHNKLSNAIAYVVGAAYGPAYISTSYNKLAGLLEALPNADGTYMALPIGQVTRRLEFLLSIYKAADAIQTCDTPTKKKAQWKVGLYSAYIIYSIVYAESDPDMMQEVKNNWVDFLVAVRRRPSIVSLLYAGMAKSNNITEERLQKGFENLFRPVRILNERFLNKSPTKKILSYLRNYSIWIASCLKSVHIFSPH